MKRSEVSFGLARIPVDALAIWTALLLAYRLRESQVDLIPGYQLLEPAKTLPELGLFLKFFALPSVAVFLLMSTFLGLYQLRSTRGAFREIGGVILAVLLWLVCVMTWFFFVEKSLFYSRILLFHAVFFAITFSILGRMALVLVQRALLLAGIGTRIVVSVGHHPIASVARDTLKHDIRYRYVGHLPDFASFQKLTHVPVVDLVIQTDPNPGSDETIGLIDYCRSHQIGYGFLPPVFADVPHQLRVERLGMLPLLRFQPTPIDGWGRVLKRVFDFLFSILFLILLSPLFLLLALGVLLDGGRPIFYVSRRVGERGRGRISVLKFRSMCCDADAKKEELTALSHRSDGPLFKVKGDPRVTRFGRFLRRWSFDELPNLFNVLIGQMSLVGPRPHLPEEVERYSPLQRRVFAVKPGITGLAQVMGRSDLPFEDEVRFDMQYVEEWSVLLDLWIVWRTAWVILKREGAD
ncbi:MAG: exopolysaccharide biosynthesis polyprenyl glycosylphosphotransferase [Candidatus Peregrinibacteria bacterium]